MNTASLALKIVRRIDSGADLAAIRRECFALIAEITDGHAEAYLEARDTAELCEVEQSLDVHPPRFGNAFVQRLNKELKPVLFIGKDCGEYYRIWRVA